MDWLSGARSRAEKGRLLWYVLAFCRRARAWERALEMRESGIVIVCFACSCCWVGSTEGVGVGGAGWCAERAFCAAAAANCADGEGAGRRLKECAGELLPDRNAGEADLCWRLLVLGLGVGGFAGRWVGIVDGMVLYVAGFRGMVAAGVEETGAEEYLF